MSHPDKLYLPPIESQLWIVKTDWFCGVTVREAVDALEYCGSAVAIRVAGTINALRLSTTTSIVRFTS